MFPTSQAPKIVHDLVRDGYLIRVRRGIYQAVTPHHFIEGVVERSQNTKDIVEKAERPYAFCDITAVAVWTSGYYWTGFTKGYKPFHIKVAKKDLSYWQDFLKMNQARFAQANENRTLFGFVYILHPQRSVNPVEHEGQFVMSLEDTVKFCLDYELGYQPALEYLDEHFNIDYTQRVSLET